MGGRVVKNSGDGSITLGETMSQGNHWHDIIMDTSVKEAHLGETVRKGNTVKQLDS